MSASGLTVWAGEQLAPLGTLHPVLLVGLAVLLVILLTELTSNVASVSAILPVLAALASAVGVAPELLIVPAALSASCAFMLPVATAPNAIVYASGEVSMAQMIKAGFRINLVAAPVIALLASLVGPWMYG